MAGTAKYAHRAVLALGSNLGESEDTLERAVADLVAGGVQLVRASGLYCTAPVGGPAGQPDFVNAVIEVTTDLGAYELLKLCNSVEAAHHRERLVRWGPRTLDIDVIDYDGVISEDPVLTLPHPRAQERAFVLVPWAQMDPQAHLTVTHRAEPSGERPDEVPAPLSREVVNVAELARMLVEADEDAISYMREMKVPD
ncbi:2-amino-4-hydroxy-6-hydroxymethyldihydropteridine diphosphokinase [Rothia mucilaginosa]|nr:2-amino-4-hydroxy-6-hydroxymethyldihydropteridine diphosphokinase [uncultured Rothia sp.]